MARIKKSYLTFHQLSDSGKTKVWTVENETGLKLGTIGWYAPWRRYTFAPSGDSIFDLECMTEIVLFVQKQMQDYKLEYARRTGKGVVKAMLDIYGQPEP